LGTNRYQSNTYNFWEFEAPGVQLTGKIYDYGVDTDPNGLSNYVEIAIEVIVNKSGEYQFYGNLYNYAGGQSYEFSSGTIYLSDTITFQNVTFEVNRHWFLNSMNGSMVYLNYLRIYQKIETFGDLEIFYDGSNRDLSNIYYHKILDLPAAKFTGKIYDYGNDTDANGRFDYLSIAFEVEINEPGTYWMSLNFYANESGQSEGMNSDHITFDSTGTYNFTFHILHTWILSQPNGTAFYIRYVYLYQYTEGIGDYRLYYNNTMRFLTGTYYHSDFDLSDAFVVKILDDYVVDVDTDGDYDFWYVVFQVNVTVPEIDLYLYTTLRGNKTGEESGVFLDSESEYSYDLPYGLHNITLEFDGVDIYNSGFSQVAFINEYRLEDITDWQWLLLDQSWDDIPLTAADNYEQFTAESPNHLEITSIWPSDVIYQRDQTITIDVYITKHGTAEVDYVSVSVKIDGVYYDSWDLIESYDGGSYESWTVSNILLEKGGLWELTVSAINYGISEDTYSASFFVLGGPIFFGFTANTSSLMIDEWVHFEADAWDEDGIQNLTLHIEGQSLSYPLTHAGNASIGELWVIDVQFNALGQYSVYLVGVDMNGTSSRSDYLTIYVNEGPRIFSVDVSPSTSVEIGTEVEFTVEVEITNAIITSVSLDVEDEDGIHTSVALEESGSYSDRLVYSGKFTPKKSGRQQSQF
jgi:hypothetical protein